MTVSLETLCVSVVGFIYRILCKNFTRVLTVSSHHHISKIMISASDHVNCETKEGFNCVLV